MTMIVITHDKNRNTTNRASVQLSYALCVCVVATWPWSKRTLRTTNRHKKSTNKTIIQQMTNDAVTWSLMTRHTTQLQQHNNNVRTCECVCLCEYWIHSVWCFFLSAALQLHYSWGSGTFRTTWGNVFVFTEQHKTINEEHYLKLGECDSQQTHYKTTFNTHSHTSVLQTCSFCSICFTISVFVEMCDLCNLATNKHTNWHGWEHNLWPH